MNTEQVKWNYKDIARGIAERYEDNKLTEEQDESGAEGFWDLAMELAEMQLPLPAEHKFLTDKDLSKRDEVATLIYYSFLGAINK